jgi:deoxyadenosine/deoxycytidine kinase
MLVVNIIGNIGSGKSTTLIFLRELGYHVIQEDVNGWKKYLELFYDDPKRWCYTLQMVILRSIRKQYDDVKKLNIPVVFIESSTLSCLIFAKINFMLGNLNEDEFSLFINFYNDLEFKADKIIYLKTDVDECYDRILKRGRDFEKNVQKTYLTYLKDEFEKIQCDIEIDTTGLSTNEIVSKIFFFQ